MSKQEQLTARINQLLIDMPELKAVFLTTLDGLPITQATGPGFTGDPNRMAAMAAAALGVGRRISDTFGSGTLRETTFNGSEGQVFLFSAGENAVLVVVAAREANIGLIRIEAHQASQDVAAIF